MDFAHLISKFKTEHGCSVCGKTNYKSKSVCLCPIMGESLAEQQLYSEITATIRDAVLRLEIEATRKRLNGTARS